MAFQSDILTNLSVAPGPQTATELRDALRRSGLKFEEFEVLQELRRLQNQGVVRVEGTRWRLLQMPANSKNTPARRKPSPLPDGAATMDGRTNAVISPVIAPPPAPAGRWAQFRAMCHYYMDCLLQDEAPQLRAYVETEADQGMAVRNFRGPRLMPGGDFVVSPARERATFHANRSEPGADERTDR